MAPDLLLHTVGHSDWNQQQLATRLQRCCWNPIKGHSLPSPQALGEEGSKSRALFWRCTPMCPSVFLCSDFWMVTKTLFWNSVHLRILPESPARGTFSVKSFRKWVKTHRKRTSIEFLKGIVYLKWSEKPATRGRNNVLKTRKKFRHWCPSKRPLLKCCI